MKISTPAIIAGVITLPIAVLVGVWLGQAMPLLSLVFLAGLVVLVVWILSGNKGGANASADRVADALTMRAPDGKARIYILRRGFVGGQQGMNITLSTGHKGQMRTNKYLVADVDPGSYVVMAQLNKQSSKFAASSDIELSAGDVILLTAGMEMGMLRATPYFTETRDRVAARNEIGGAVMVEWSERP
jgi:hypothetical protein